MPDDLGAQIEPLFEAIRALGWPLLQIEGVEADDVIGTLAREAERHEMRCVISTGDKDLAQLVSDRVTLVNTMTNERLDPDGVKAKFGVPPERFLDYLTLVGDSVDNVPGVDKVGPKTAGKWLSEYGSLESLVANAAKIGGTVGENLRKALDWLPQGRALLAVKCDVELPLRMEELKLAPRDEKRVAAAVLALRFQELVEGRRGTIGRGACLGSCRIASQTGSRAHHRDALHGLRSEALAQCHGGRGAGFLRYRDDEPRSDAGAARGPRFLRRRGPRRLSAARAQLRRGAAAVGRRAGACDPEAVAGERNAPEGRPKRQISRARVRQPRHRLAGHRARHAARIIRARKPHAPRPGKSRLAPSRREDDRLRRGDRDRSAAHPVRAGRCRAGRGVCRRRRRPRPADPRCAFPEDPGGSRARPRLRLDRDAGARGPLQDGKGRACSSRRGNSRR